VIGIVTSTNGGAGTYEVDLSLGQPQAGGAGGGATIGSGAYAALPALCNAGDAYIPTDSAYDILRCNPANTWNHYRDGQLLIPPVLADFAWINQGAATAVNTYGGVYVTSPAGAGTNLSILKKAAPATPYTITAAVLPNYMAIDFHGGGILFRESGTGTLAALEIGHDNNDFQYHSMKFTNPTTFSAFYTTQAARYLPALVWLQISDDGVNRISRFSLNGKDFFTLHAVGRTDFLTADEVGFWNDSNNATYGTNLWVIHWVQS
jgi:hypothetical protein